MSSDVDLQVGRAGRGRSRRRAGARVVRRLLARRALAAATDAGARPTAAATRRRPTARRCRSRPTSTRCSCPPASRATRPASRPATRSCCSPATPPADYPTVVMFVDTSAPAGSRLLSKLSGNGHQGGTVYAAGSPEYQTILHWIRARSTAMNRRLNVVATRACLAAAVAVARRRARLRPARERRRTDRRRPRAHDRRDRIAPRHRRQDGRRSRSRPRTATDASYTFTSADPTIATVDGAGVVTGVAPGETVGDHHGRRLAGDRRLPDLRRRRAPTRSPTTTPGRCRRTPTRPPLAFNNWNQDGQVPTVLRPLPQLGGVRRLHRRRRQRARASSTSPRRRSR